MRGHSITTWTRFWSFLTPSPPLTWTILIDKNYQIMWTFDYPPPLVQMFLEWPLKECNDAHGQSKIFWCDSIVTTVFGHAKCRGNLTISNYKQMQLWWLFCISSHMLRIRYDTRDVVKNGKNKTLKFIRNFQDLSKDLLRFPQLFFTFLKIGSDSSRFVDISQDSSKFIQISQDFLRFVKICKDSLKDFSRFGKFRWDSAGTYQMCII